MVAAPLTSKNNSTVSPVCCFTEWNRTVWSQKQKLLDSKQKPSCQFLECDSPSHPRQSPFASLWMLWSTCGWPAGRDGRQQRNKRLKIKRTFVHQDVNLKRDTCMVDWGEIKLRYLHQVCAAEKDSAGEKDETKCSVISRMWPFLQLTWFTGTKTVTREDDGW